MKEFYEQLADDMVNEIAEVIKSHMRAVRVVKEEKNWEEKNGYLRRMIAELRDEKPKLILNALLSKIMKLEMK
jgi:hypothetical protein